MADSLKVIHSPTLSLEVIYNNTFILLCKYFQTIKVYDPPPATFFERNKEENYQKNIKILKLSPISIGCLERQEVRLQKLKQR